MSSSFAVGHQPDRLLSDRLLSDRLLSDRLLSDRLLSAVERTSAVSVIHPGVPQTDVEREDFDEQ